MWYISDIVYNQRDVISRINEEVDRRSTSDKSWFDSCDRCVILTVFNLDNNCSHYFAVPNILLSLCDQIRESYRSKNVVFDKNWRSGKQKIWTSNLKIEDQWVISAFVMGILHNWRIYLHGFLAWASGIRAGWSMKVNDRFETEWPPYSASTVLLQKWLWIE